MSKEKFVVWSNLDLDLDDWRADLEDEYPGLNDDELIEKMFLADSKTFSLDMISGLEAYAIGKAHDSKRYKVENSVNPKYEIDEYDLPSIEEVYEEIQFIMATQGCHPCYGIRQDLFGVSRLLSYVELHAREARSVFG